MSLNARRYEKGVSPSPRRRAPPVPAVPRPLTVADIEADGGPVYRGLALLYNAQIVTVRNTRAVGRGGEPLARCYMGTGHNGYPVCRWHFTGALTPYKRAPRSPSSGTGDAE